MAVQDLTPQLRTRLSRLEKVVGWFVTLATLLLLAGLGYYVYKVAQRKGWFLTKAPYFTFLDTGAGIKVGDPVRLMGFEAGEITRITADKPESGENVYVEFLIRDPYIGYIWNDSIVRVKSAGLLGARYLEVTKGGTRSQTDLSATYKQEDGKIVGIWDRTAGIFTNWAKGDPPYEVFADEPPELSSQLDQMVQVLKVSLTNILVMTNALTKTLTNAAEATGNLNEILTAAKPAVTNLVLITENLKNPRGSLGDWLFPTNMNLQITSLLTNANATVLNVNSTVTNVNTNLVSVLSNITVSLDNLAGITSNLNAQVQGNTNLVKSVSDLIVHSDDLIQGLKRHWLLRSAFKKKDKEEGADKAPQDQQSLRPRPPKGAGRE